VQLSFLVHESRDRSRAGIDHIALARREEVEVHGLDVAADRDGRGIEPEWRGDQRAQVVSVAAEAGQSRVDALGPPRREDPRASSSRMSTTTSGPRLAPALR
jgi:hypothetical protein